MNEEVKAKWVAALRSGEYVQTVGRLHRTKKSADGDPGFCCLGVLCEIAVKEGVIPGYEDWEGYPDREVLEWAGILEYIPDPEDNAQNWPIADTAIHLNDGSGWSFDQIADWVETL